MSADDPTSGEIWRKLTDVVTRLDQIVERLDRRDTYIDESYVRRQVWHEARRADQAALANVVQDVGGIQARQDTDRAWRRQVLLTVACSLVASLLSIAGLVVTIVLSVVG